MTRRSPNSDIVVSVDSCIDAHSSRYVLAIGHFGMPEMFLPRRVLASKRIGAAKLYCAQLSLLVASSRIVCVLQNRRREARALVRKGPRPLLGALMYGQNWLAYVGWSSERGRRAG